MDHRSGPRVLIVEDEAIVANQIQRKLAKLGYEVVGKVRSGEEAITLAQASRPDIILMDIGIEGSMDGVQTAATIRSRFDIPVIYLTAHADEGTLARARVTEPLGYIVKPFEEIDLKSTLDIALYRHRADRKLRASEERYRNLFEDIPVPLFRATGDGRIENANRALFSCLRMPGRSLPQEIRLSDLMGDRREAERYQRLLAREGIVRDFETRVRRRDGTEIWVSITSKLMDAEPDSPDTGNGPGGADALGGTGGVRTPNGGEGPDPPEGWREADSPTRSRGPLAQGGPGGPDMPTEPGTPHIPGATTPGAPPRSLIQEGSMVDITLKKEAEEEMMRRLMKFKLEPGAVYLVPESAPVLSLEALKDLTGLGYRGIVLSRTPEREWIRLVGQGPTFLWLGERGRVTGLRPDPREITEFISTLGRNTVLLLDRLDYLMTKITPSGVVALVQDIRELAFLKRFITILTLDPDTVDPQAFRLIEKECREVEPLHQSVLPPDFMGVLRYIHRQNTLGVSPSNSMMSKALHISRPTVRKRLNSLCSRGYLVEHTRGNRKVIELTERGRSIFYR